MNDIKSALSPHLQIYKHAEKSVASEKAWREALDKQIYQKNTMSHIDHSNSSIDEKNSTVGAEQKKVFLLSSTTDSNVKRDMANNFKTDQTASSADIAGKDHRLIRNTESNLSQTMSAFHPAPEKTSLTNINKGEKAYIEPITWQKLKVDKSDVLLKILPDGEVLVRNYISTSPSMKKIHEFAQSIRDIFGQNVEKIKLNGSTVWQNMPDAMSHKNSNHTINLIY